VASEKLTMDKLGKLGNSGKILLQDQKNQEQEPQNLRQKRVCVTCGAIV